MIYLPFHLFYNQMIEDQIAKDIVDACYHVHVALGPGLLESVYEEVLAHELRLRGYNVERQKPISIVYKGSQMDMAFRVDLIVDNLVIIELKSVEELAPVRAFS